MALSNRYLRWIAAALLVALIPVIPHSYLKLKSNDCVSVQELCALCPGRMESESVGRRLAGQFGEVEWCAGTLPAEGNFPTLDCWILRSYDPKKLYHLPEIGLMRGAAPGRRLTQFLTWENRKVPLHRAFYPAGDGDVYVAYMLIYNSKPVDNPYITQILSFPKQLVTGVEPMNLFFVSGRGPRGSLAGMEERGNQWLIEALRFYHSLCKD